jgi:aerobic-type carbon monoxide dehydrogenase small subunit (CoxS/CutS family)
MVRSGSPIMFSINDEEVELNEAWREQIMEMLRNAYGHPSR